MKTYQQVVAEYAGIAPRLGTAAPFPAAQLRDDLKSVARGNGRYFLVIFVILVALLLLAVAVLAKFFDQPYKAAAILAASGISIPFILRMMLKMWESKVKSEALLILATSLDENVLRTVVATLAQPPKS